MIRSLLLFSLSFCSIWLLLFFKKVDLIIISCIDQAISRIVQLDSNLIALFVSNSKSSQIDSKDSVSNQNSTVDWIGKSGVSRQTHNHLTDSFIYTKGYDAILFMRGRRYSNRVSYLILVAKEGDLFIDRLSSENVSE